MKLKKLVKCSLATALIFGSVGAISGCKKDNNTIEKTQQEEVYNLYVQYMSAKGETPLTYEQWLNSIKGDKGDPGKDGISPKVRINTTNNYWEISTDNGTTWTSTGVKATGAEGDDGHTPEITIGNNGNWFVDGKDTSVKARGEDAIAPKIRINQDTKYWEISTDNGLTWVPTGVRAKIEIDYEKLEELLEKYGKITLEEINEALNDSTNMNFANPVAVIPFKHIDGPRNERQFYAFINFQYKEREYVKYQVTYLSDTSRTLSTAYWSTAYIEMSLPESGKADDSVLRTLSFDKDGTGYYNAGVWGDSNPIMDYENNIIVTYDKISDGNGGYHPSIKEDYIPLLIGKTKREIDQWYIMDDIKACGVMSQETFDSFTGASVSTNNILRILHSMFKYHADTFINQ
jgi:hypothetical protein